MVPCFPVSILLVTGIHTIIATELSYSNQTVSFTISRQSYNMKNTNTWEDSTFDFFQWKVQLKSQILARSKCHPYETFTLNEIFRLCNPSNPYSQIPKCNIPISLTCGNTTINSVSNLGLLGDLVSTSLILAPPTDAPFVSMISSIPYLPMYDIAATINAIARNDTLSFVVFEGMSQKSPGNAKYFPSALARELDLVSCSGGEVAIGRDCEDCEFEFIDLMTNEPISELKIAFPQSLPCSVSGVGTFNEFFATTLSKIQTAKSPAECEKAMNSLNLLTNLEAFIGCSKIIEGMMSLTEVPVEINGNRGCNINPANEQFWTDPCCNQRLLIDHCCPERTVTVNLSLIDSINYTIINRTIPPSPNKSWTVERQNLEDIAVVVLNEFAHAQLIGNDSQYGCEAALQAAIPPNFFENSTRFLLNCYNIIYGGMVKSGNAAAICVSDDDCYTSCNVGTNKCFAPTNENSLEAFVSCSLDLMSPDVLFLLRDQLRVTAEPANTLSARLAAKMKDAVTEPGCFGPDEFSIGACVIDISVHDCRTLQALFPAKDGKIVPSLPVMTIRESNRENGRPDENEDPYPYQSILVRKDLKNATACASANLNLSWVTVAFGGAGATDVCRVPLWVNTQDGSSSSALSSGCSVFDGSCGDPSYHRRFVYDDDQRRNRALRRGNSAFLKSRKGSSSRMTRQLKPEMESISRSVRAGESAVHGVNETLENDTISNSWTKAWNATGSGNIRTSILATADNQSTSSTILTTATLNDLPNPLCYSTNDVCNSLTADQWRVCSEMRYYLKVCGVLPDAEGLFDPTSACAVLTNRLMYAPMEETLPGMGSCKVTNFGFTDGLLPVGFMSSSLIIDWHSPLSIYEDRQYQTFKISAMESSIAETRCMQVKDAVAALGFAAESSTWYRYDTQTYSYFDASKDAYVDQIFPGNSSLCELEKKCNSDNPWALHLNRTQCSDKSPEEFCGVKISNSSFTEISEAVLCYLPYDPDVDSSEYPSRCEGYGGTWDYLGGLSNPTSAYLCSASPTHTVENCFTGCYMQSVFDWDSQKNISSFGSCETYYICSVDTNYSVCTSPKEDPNSWVLSYDGKYPKWMGLDSGLNLVEGTMERGQCVVAYRSLNDRFDFGGDQYLLASKENCERVKLQVFHHSSLSENITAQWNPPRGLRAEFMNNNKTCKNTCTEELRDHSFNCNDHSSGFCTVSCRGCRALMNSELQSYNLSTDIVGGIHSSICVDPVMNQTLCRLRTGWKFSTLSQICYKTILDTCNSPYQLWSCNLFDTIAGGDSFCQQYVLYGEDNETLLKCVYDTDQQCADERSCELSGVCDDEYLSDPALPSWFPILPSCVIPFSTADDMGYPNVTFCESHGGEIEWSLGCVYLHNTLNKLFPQYHDTNVSRSNIIQHERQNTTNYSSSTPSINLNLSFPAMCATAGGYLASRANSQSQCETGSGRCLRDQLLVQNVDREDCTNEKICDPASYSWRFTRTWTNGDWKPPADLSAVWVKREWQAINQYVNTFSYQKMFQLISDTISSKYQGALASYAECKVGLYGSSLEKLATIVDSTPRAQAMMMISIMQDVKLIPLVSKKFAVDMNKTMAVSRRDFDLNSLMKQAVAASEQNKSMFETSSPASTDSLPLADAVVSCTSGFVKVPQTTLSAAALKTAQGNAVMDTTTIQVSTTFAAQFKDPALEPPVKGAYPRSSNIPRSLSLLDASSNCMTGYAVVQNDQGVVIGQLIGDALAVSAEGITGLPVTFCFNADPSIIQCIQNFPVVDVIVFNVSTKQRLISNVQQALLTNNNTSQYCVANILALAPGQVYFPIRRSADLFPAAIVVLLFTFLTINDVSVLDASFQMIFRESVASALPAVARVTSNQVVIKSVCKTDGTECMILPTTRRLMGTGVVVTTEITTPAASEVSTGASGSIFVSSFVTAWNLNTNASLKFSASDLAVQSEGIIQPLVPVVVGSSKVINSVVSSTVLPETSPTLSSPEYSSVPTTAQSVGSFFCLNGATVCQNDESVIVLEKSGPYYPRYNETLSISWNNVNLHIPQGAWPMGDSRPLRILTINASGTILSSAASSQGAVFASPINYFTPSGIMFATPVTISVNVNSTSSSSKPELYRYNLSSNAWDLTMPCSGSAEPAYACGQTASFSAYAPLQVAEPISFSSGSSCNSGCIAGAVIGSVAGAAFLLFLGYWFVLRLAKEEKQRGISINDAREEGRSQAAVTTQLTTDLSKRERAEPDSQANLGLPAANNASTNQASRLLQNVSAQISAPEQGIKGKEPRIKTQDEVEWDV